MPGGTTLANAYVQILPSAKGIKGNIENELGGAGTTAGGLFSTKFSKAAKFSALGAALGKSLMEGANLEQSIGGVETLFKQNADEVIKNADKAWKTAGLSANQYMEQSTSFAASLLQSLDGDTKKAASAADQAIVDMADNANKMGTSVDMIQNAYQGFAKQNYTMLDNLKLGYGGTRTEMERLLQDAGKISGQKYDISNLSDVYEAIHVIQTEMDITGTTAKEGASTLSGSFAAMKGAAQNFLGDLALGRNIGPAMSDMISSAVTFVAGNLIPAIGNIFKSLPTAIRTFMSQGIPQLASVGKDLLNSFINGANGFADEGVKLMQDIANGIVAAIPVVIQKGPVIVGRLADAINNNAPKLLLGAGKMMLTIAKGIIMNIPTLIRNIPRIFTAIAKAWMAIQWFSLGKLAVTGIKKGITSLAGTIGTAVKSKLANIKSAITAPFTKALGTLKGIVNKIKGLFPLSIGKIFSNLKIPHIKISGGKAPFGIGGLGTKPKISVSWNKKAMENPYLFSDATLFGAGEAGDEVLYGKQNLLNDISEAVRSAGGSGGGTLQLVINLDGKTIGQATVDYLNGQTLMFGTSPALV